MFDELVAWLETVDADVICLQEVTRTAHRSGWSTFADGERTLPQRLSLFDDVSAVLTDFTPHPTNTRAACVAAAEKYADQNPMFGNSY